MCDVENALPKDGLSGECLGIVRWEPGPVSEVSRTCQWGVPKLRNLTLP